MRVFDISLIIFGVLVYNLYEFFLCFFGFNCIKRDNFKIRIYIINGYLNCNFI